MTLPSTYDLPSPFDDGELYDVVLGDLDFGLDYYLDLARSADGPVLDLCCGTGRILLPALQLGVDIEGLDLYESMLDRLREKASEMGLHPRLHRADMSDFRLDRQFARIIVPFNAIIHNLTTESQIRCLRLCREHLLPDGCLVFDTFFPGPEFLGVPSGTRVLEREIRHPASGLQVRIYDTRTFDRVGQLQHSMIEIEYLEESGKIVRTHPSQTTLRWMYKNEVDLLLRLAEYSRWDIYGEFDGRPLEKDTDLMVVQAWKQLR